MSGVTGGGRAHGLWVGLRHWRHSERSQKQLLPEPTVPRRLSTQVGAPGGKPPGATRRAVGRAGILRSRGLAPLIRLLPSSGTTAKGTGWTMSRHFCI
jgi:hypothetical protein